MDREKKSTLTKGFVSIFSVVLLIAMMTFTLIGCSNTETTQTDPCAGSMAPTNSLVIESEPTTHAPTAPGSTETNPTEPDTTEPTPTTPVPTEPATEPTSTTPAPTVPVPTAPTPTQPVVTTYTVTFKDYDGKVLKTQTVEKGKAATAPANPTRENCTFAGWDKTFSNVTGDLVVTATYTMTSTKLTIYAESVTVNKGTNQVRVNIRVRNNPGIMGAILKVSVNDKIFAFEKGSKSGYPGLVLTSPGAATKSSPYTFMLDAMELSDSDRVDGTLFTITFTIKDTTAVGNFTVDLSYDQGAIFDENYADLKVVLEDGIITIQ